MTGSASGALRFAATLTAATFIVSVGHGRTVLPPQDARMLIESGSFQRAEEVARGEYGALRARHGDDAEPVTTAGDTLVRALVQNGRAADTGSLELAQQILVAKERHLGPDHAGLLPSLLNLGDVLVAAADFDRAIAVTRRALAIAEKHDGPNGLEAAEALDHLGDALTEASRYDEAVATLARSLRVKEAALASSHVGLARTLESLSLVLQSKGEYSRSALLIGRAAAIRRAASERHPAYAGTLNLLAQQLWFEGLLQESKEASEQAVAVATASLRADHPLLALSLRYLANTLADLGDLSQSLELTQRALTLAQRNFGPAHHVTAEYLHSLGLAELAQGAYPAARQHFQQALTIYESRYGPWHELVATAHSVLAMAEARLGDYAGARREQALAVASFTRVGGPTHPYVANALSKLAAVYLDEGLPAQARPLLERALAIREQALGPEHRDVARTLADLGSTLMQTGQPVRAQPLARRALDIWKRLDAPDAPDYATVLALYAELQAHRGDNAAARDSFARAMEIRARVYGLSNPLYAEVQAGLAQALADLGDRDAALESALAAETTGRDHLRLMLRSLPERQALNYAASRPQALSLILSLSSSMPDVVPAAFDGFIRTRALVLDEIAARHGSGRTDPARAALASAQQRLANLTVRGPGEMTPDRYAALVEDARRESERAEQALAERSVAFREERSRAQIGLSDVLASLPADTALVSFARYDRSLFPAQAAAPSANRSPRPSSRRVPSYTAFVLRKDQPPVVVPLGSVRAIDALVSQWRADIAAEVTGGPPPVPGETARSSRGSGAALRKMVWDPIVAHLADAARAVIVPDGALGLVPFAALPIARRSFLVESGPVIHYLSAERDLALPPAVPGARGAPGGLLAMGGPAFDRRPGSRQAGAPDATGVPSAGPALRGVGQPCVDLQSIRFEPLIGTAREVREVSALWATTRDAKVEPDGAQVLVGAAASETTFKTDAPHRRVLHLATHGFFLGSACAPAPSGTRGVGGLARAGSAAARNPLRLSGLALAGANRRAQARADEDDGILTAEEVATLDLSGVEWAVLSACDTGVGEIKAGEGVFGLRRAFQVAGARTVIMSLWSVEDQATRAWMRALYEGRFQRHLSTADAVHQASHSVLQDRRARGLGTHPFFWAAFVAAGDWR